MRTINDCQEGDIVMHPGGNRYKVLGRLNSLIFLSESYDYNLAHYRTFTIDQLIKEGWKLLVDGKEPMTVKEVERLMNIKVTE